jgi:glyoxylase-like metal-dependent hydrolase (beta-lactamase superfamily II)
MTPFSVRFIGRDTWLIQGEGCDAYLLPGDEEAVMIDAGCSTENIRTFAQTLTDLPVRAVVNTHSHFDHTGGSGWFETVYQTAGVARSAKNTMGAPRALYPLDYAPTLISGGTVLPFAGRPLEVIELNCHSPGDVVLLDLKHATLFTGDELESGQVLLLPGYAERTGQIHASPAAAVETYRNAVRAMRSREAEFDRLCPAHNGSPLPTVYLSWYEALCEAILAGLEGDPDCASPTYRREVLHFPFPEAGYRRARHMGASLVYNARLLRESDRSGGLNFFPATPLHLVSAYSI